MQNAVMTKKGKQKLIQARAGNITLPPIRWIAFGDAGATPSGEPIVPLETETQLKREVVRVEVTSKKVVENTCTYVGRIEADQAIGKAINELALVDSAGDLIAIKRFKSKLKDAGIPMIFEVVDKII